MKFSFERECIKAVSWARGRPNYGMGNMNHGLEEVCGNKRELSGPLVDSYLLKIRKQMSTKLSPSRTTQLGSLVILFIPWPIFRHITVLFRGYGGEVKFDGKKLKITSTLSSMETVEKVFSPSRFEGQDLLRKRHFSHVAGLKGEVEFLYKGNSSVVVSNNSPLTLDYNLKSQKVNVTVYIQQYRPEDFLVDSFLQNLNQ
ncbi:hypothetical protein P5673_020827 [Acropora cervicornis]|uniref:Uncharacterized protein n=1 Tax=Acropora cervicornis TaxID=6130 RepID=A0AAD9V0T4_ACRCE|nr:hypothetical protein P5673_020827 [Acropora cervicornis]